tara:strand:+ start:925 stop:1551 length:627 start_codon:yes stop_codon:yes gene_type:complete
MIVPTILVKTKEEFIDRRSELKPHFKIAHLDVMDGKFVPNKTLPLDNIKRSKLQYEVHLMVKDNLTHIKKALKLHPSAILFHYESCRDNKEVAALINFIKKRKIKAGLAINPETSTLKIKPFLGEIDRLMIMAVSPGFSGQRFKGSVLTKIKAIRKLNKKLLIEIDGGINEETLIKTKKAGANMFCAGSFLTGPDIKQKKLILHRLAK